MKMVQPNPLAQILNYEEVPRKAESNFKVAQTYGVYKLHVCRTGSVTESRR
jgi:hypothetical protein